MPLTHPTTGRLLALHPQPIPVLPLLGVFALAVYLYGVLVLTRSGKPWPWVRSACWIAGIALMELATATGVEGYGMMIFSVHMAQHMALAMVVPILLVCGAPVELALATLPRSGEAVGVRNVLVGVLDSRIVTIVCSAPVRWVLFVGSLYGVYFTPMFGVLMHTVWGHTLLLAYFIAAGCVFFGPLIAPLPGRRLRPAASRLAEAFASTPLHAAFGIVIMFSAHPVVSFFDNSVPGWGISTVPDQTLAGGIAWVTAETATVLVMIVIAASAWTRRRIVRTGS